MTHPVPDDGQQGYGAPSTEAPVPLLAARDVTVTYRGSGEPVVAMAGATVAIWPQERVALVGESGSGKTTLGLALAGLLASPQVQVTASTLTFAGQPLVSRRGSGLPTRTPGIAMVFQDAMTSLDPVWTIGSQLTAVAAGHVEHVMPPGQGQRPRLAAAGRPDRHRAGPARTSLRAVRRNAAAGDDRDRAVRPPGAARLPMSRPAPWTPRCLGAPWSCWWSSPEQSDAALLIISHDIALCQEFTHRTLVAYQGRLVDEGPSDRLHEVAGHPYTRGLLRCVPTLHNAGMDELPTLESIYDEIAAADAEARPVPLSVSA